MVELQFVEIHNWFLLCVRVRSSLTVALDPAVGSIRTPEAAGMVYFFKIEFRGVECAHYECLQCFRTVGM